MPIRELLQAGLLTSKQMQSETGQSQATISRELKALDKDVVRITKRRSVAQDMISNKVVLINDVVAKASKNVEVGSVITINYLESSKKYEVLKIPTAKSTPKSLQDEYIKEVS